ncbi:hypothetical protein PIB30_060776 [Stylosanthes scabra]|uniref:Protein MIZU-KUSSEI 1 n=1 Tax=Stylosanthes scabra TaxID=79078 RepID=A0ABU6QLN0_9FABA|nr:hypothetical protein [Stylosanthes scabra]
MANNLIKDVSPAHHPCGALLNYIRILVNRIPHLSFNHTLGSKIMLRTSLLKEPAFHTQTISHALFFSAISHPFPFPPPSRNLIAPPTMAIDALRRFFFPCFFPSRSTTTRTTTAPQTPTASKTSFSSSTSTKKRFSTSSLRHHRHPTTTTIATSPSSSTTSSSNSSRVTVTVAPPRPSKSMVIGTIFGNRGGHVWFCVQHDRLSSKPSLLLKFPISTNDLVREMRNGLLRIALECNPHRPDLATCPLRSVPVWTVFCNGRKAGFAARRRAGERVRSVLKTMRCVTVGAGVIPAGFSSGQNSGKGSGSEELMYMRANFEHVVGSADSESFHLINPDDGPGQELSVFLLRSRLGVDR